MQDDSPPQASWNQHLAHLLIDACVGAGVDDFFVAPGSRCTPLTIAIVNHPGVRRIVQHFDERGLAFACVGFGRATGRPAAFVCTSGTAVANALPAVVESSLDHVPLLLLTADRPPELRDTGANQTIDQTKIFQNFTRWFFDLPCPAEDSSASFWQSTVRHAIERAAAGPVQLNCMFREPFDVSDAFSSIDTASPLASSQPVSLKQTTTVTLPAGKTLVMAGGGSRQVAESAQHMAARLGCPFLSDISNGIRGLAYDLALMRDNLPVPERILHVGGRVVSKRWTRFVTRAVDAQLIHYWPHAERLDPLHRSPKVIRGDLVQLCNNTVSDSTGDPAFFSFWQQESQSAYRAACEAVSQDEKLSEPRLAWELAQRLPPSSGLLLGNSLPIRHMDQFGFWPVERKITVATNRGASGIDGLLATAVGFALGRQTLVTALMGDLSTLHDLNSLALLARSDVPVVLIVINNDGGGIFHFLPVARETQHFEQYFGTPHGWTFQAAAHMFGLPYSAPQTVDEFRAAYDGAIASRRACVLEVTTRRSETFDMHGAIESAVRGNAK